jgi:hypothetical protein
MKTKTSPPTDTAVAWQRMVQFKGELSLSAARALLTFGFSEHDHARMCELSAKARAGTLTATEQADLDTFERLGCVLDIIHSQARLALKKTPKRAS